jgi:hypothetical protein
MEMHPQVQCVIPAGRSSGGRGCRAISGAVRRLLPVPLGARGGHGRTWESCATHGGTGWVRARCTRVCRAVSAPSPSLCRPPGESPPMVMAWRPTRHATRVAAQGVTARSSPGPAGRWEALPHCQPHREVDRNARGAGEAERAWHMAHHRADRQPSNSAPWPASGSQKVKRVWCPTPPTHRAAGLWQVPDGPAAALHCTGLDAYGSQ